MVDAIGTALVGLNRASDRLEASARKIAAGTEFNVADVGQPDSGTNAVQPPSDISDALIDQKLASYDFKANLQTIKVADNVQQYLLNIIT